MRWHDALSAEGPASLHSLRPQDAGGRWPDRFAALGPEEPFDAVMLAALLPRPSATAAT
jgi:hypothetical protein